MPHQDLSCGIIRETNDVWLLLTVETEVNGDSRSTNDRVPPWLVRWARRAVIRDVCFALAALVGPVQPNFFLTVHYFNSCVPIAQQAGQQSCLVACLLLLVSVSGYLSQANLTWPDGPFNCRPHKNP